MTSSSTAINRGGANSQSRLLRVTVNDPAAQTLTLYEGTTAAGEVIAVVDCANAGTYEYGVTVTGLTASLDGNADVTVIYQ
jgi:hypothetical protein